MKQRNIDFNFLELKRGQKFHFIDTSILTLPLFTVKITITITITTTITIMIMITITITITKTIMIMIMITKTNMFTQEATLPSGGCQAGPE